jgi:malate synthase
VQDARDGKFEGGEIPADLQCQWIQGTGPAAKPNSPLEASIRNVAYALLSGADGWMFDGEDALGQITSMSLDNQRNLKLAIAKDPVFLKTAENVAASMNKWGNEFFGHDIIKDWEKQLDFTTKIFRARGLHLDDRHIRDENGVALSASIVDRFYMLLIIIRNCKKMTLLLYCTFQKFRPPKRFYMLLIIIRNCKKMTLLLYCTFQKFRPPKKPLYGMKC